MRFRDLQQIKGERMTFLGDPQYGCQLYRVDFVGFARACGGTRVTVEKLADRRCVLAEALVTPGSVVVEGVADLQKSPMPPKVSAVQVTKLAESLMRCTPNREQIAWTTLSDQGRQLI